MRNWLINLLDSFKIIRSDAYTNLYFVITCILYIVFFPLLLIFIGISYIISIWGILGGLVLGIVAQDKILFYLKKIYTWLLPYMNEIMWVTSICFIAGCLYYLLIVFYFFFNYKAKKDNQSYLKYLRKHWEPSLAEEKEKKFIYSYIVQNITDCCIFKDQLTEFITRCSLENQEYIIDILFKLIKHYTSESQRYFAEEAIKVLQTMYKDHSRYIDDYIVNNINENFISDNNQELQRQLYIPQLSNDDYCQNVNAIHFYNTYYDKQGALLYPDLFSKTIKNIRKQMRIIWLIYDGEYFSDNVLETLYRNDSLNMKVKSFIGVLLNKDTNLSSQMAMDISIKEDFPNV